MAKISSITGVKTVIKNMKLKTALMAAQNGFGLKAAGLFLQAASQRLVPVDLGNLKASAFTRAHGFGFGTEVEVGYTAAYAVYVHENVGMKLKGQKRTGKDELGRERKGKYWDPQGRGHSKFLESPSRTERLAMRTIYMRFMAA